MTFMHIKTYTRALGRRKFNVTCYSCASKSTLWGGLTAPYAYSLMQSPFYFARNYCFQGVTVLVAAKICSIISTPKIIDSRVVGIPKRA